MRVNVRFRKERSAAAVAHKWLDGHVVVQNVMLDGPVLLAKRVATQWALCRASLDVSSEVVPNRAPACQVLRTQAAVERLRQRACQYVQEQGILLLETARANGAAVCINYNAHFPEGRVSSI